jgi:hypothetical protein
VLLSRRAAIAISPYTRRSPTEQREHDRRPEYKLVGSLPESKKSVTSVMFQTVLYGVMCPGTAMPYLRGPALYRPEPSEISLGVCARGGSRRT